MSSTFLRGYLCRKTSACRLASIPETRGTGDLERLQLALWFRAGNQSGTSSKGSKPAIQTEALPRTLPPPTKKSTFLFHFSANCAILWLFENQRRGARRKGQRTWMRIRRLKQAGPAPAQSLCQSAQARAHLFAAALGRAIRGYRARRGTEPNGASARSWPTPSSGRRSTATGSMRCSSSSGSKAPRRSPPNSIAGGRPQGDSALPKGAGAVSTDIRSRARRSMSTTRPRAKGCSPSSTAPSPDWRPPRRRRSARRGRKRRDVARASREA